MNIRYCHNHFVLRCTQTSPKPSSKNCVVITSIAVDLIATCETREGKYQDKVWAGDWIILGTDVSEERKYVQGDSEKEERLKGSDVVP